MELQLFTKAICRTPVFSCGDYLEDKWDELKQLIAESSPEFYEIIKDTSKHEINLLPEKAILTVWKYFNRAKFRATPFGGFATVSIVETSGKRAAPIRLRSQPEILKLRDWGSLATYPGNSQVTVNETLELQVNSTLYRVGKQIRYIRSLCGEFQLVCVPENKWLSFVIARCNVKTGVKELKMLMSKKFRVRMETIEKVLNTLIDAEIIFSDRRPNITGQDYFERLKMECQEKNQVYRIDHRSLLNGQLDTNRLNAIPEFFNFWRQLNLQRQPEALNNFMSAFKVKFGSNIIPLATALDPEIGVGYAGLDQQTVPFSHHLPFIAAEKNSQPETSIHWMNKEFLSFLINGIAEGKEIRLENFNQQNTTAREAFPNTFSAMISYLGDTPVLEAAGGCTGNALTGRFTLVNTAFQQLGRELAAIEQEANPEVIFFEVAFSGEGNVDNVNRRSDSYAFEFPIHVWSVTREPLILSDILVGVQDSEIVLWSIKHQKRLIPRLSSAYNYTRSPLALFRFFCDLQFSRLHTQLSFKLDEALPGCNRYPRVYFRDIIISPAMWSVPERFWKIPNGHSQELVDEMKCWLRDNNVSKYFKYGFQDQTLTFNSSDVNELCMFLKLLKLGKGRQMQIAETALPSGSVTDEQGRIYNAQMVLTYCHQENIFKTPHANFKDCSLFDKQAIFLPGSQWAYFEIYCHPVKSNAILENEIRLFLNKAACLTEKWFFVRYNAPSPHIRLRVKLKNKEQSGLLLSILKKIIEPAFEARTISDLQVKTYYPELQRYNCAGIDLVENAFWYNSVDVMALLTSHLGEEALYTGTIRFMNIVFTCLYPDIDDRINLVQRLASAFAQEFEVEIAGFKQINAGFKIIRANLTDESCTSAVHTEYLELVRKATLTITDRACSEKLVADLVHLHINRLFPDYQRQREMVLYHYLENHLKMTSARLKVQQGC